MLLIMYDIANMIIDMMLVMLRIINETIRTFNIISDPSFSYHSVGHMMFLIIQPPSSRIFISS